MANDLTTLTADERMMRRCFELAARSAHAGEYPFAAIVVREGQAIAEATNCVSQERDVTRHAELVALTRAQRTLGSTSLDDCTLYTIAEPCALCSYAIRETRIARVVFGLSSPVMGGYSRWNILGDTVLSSRMPEVFAPPPDVVSDFLSAEAAAAFKRSAPMTWGYVRLRRLLRDGRVVLPAEANPVRGPKPSRYNLAESARRLLRLQLFDRFGRGAE